MRKFLIVALFTTILLYADNSSNGIKYAILNKIVSGIVQNNTLRIWSDNEAINDFFRSTELYQVVLTCADADIIVLENEESLSKSCKKGNIFVLSYELLNKVPQSFGAFFWKKGRPNIVFIESRIEAQGLILSDRLIPYIEEKVW